MKTSKEIRKWIYTKPWAWRLVWNVICKEKWTGWKEKKVILLGNAGLYTISIGFSWGRSKEGREFWGRINKQFIDWYDNENK